MRARSMCLAIVVAASSAGAQGTLSTQGFGFPPGEFSSRALATGGGLAQLDPQSPINPATISSAGDPLLFLQYEPEFRRITLGGETQKTRTSRFPLAIASVPVRSKTTVSASVSTLLDRSWETQTTRDQPVAGDVASVTEHVRSIGAINDVRLAVGYAANTFLQFGVGAHVFTGRNQLEFQQTFPDSLHFVSVNQTTTLDYTGLGISAGVILHPSSAVAIAVSGRKGGDLKAHVADTVVATAKIPDRYGAAIAYAGFAGANLSFQVNRDLWSSINGLGSEDARAVDAWDIGGGVEGTGPRLLDRVLLVRLGARYRTLPFVAAGSEVRELSFAGGLGIQFSRNRAAFDATLQHSSRSPQSGGTLSDARERAFTLSFGLRVRP
jgi:hypothetical protein